MVRPEAFKTPPQQVTRRLTTEEKLSRLRQLVAETRLQPTLGKGDVLSISVYDEPDPGVSGIPIRPDGRISFPLIGDVQAEGFTREADLSRVHIVRGSLSNPQLIVVDFKDVLQGRAQDVPLEPNDIVYVPPTYLAQWSQMLNQIVPTITAIQTGIILGNSVGGSDGN